MVDLHIAFSVISAYMPEVSGEGSGDPGQQVPVDNFTRVEFEDIGIKLRGHQFLGLGSEELYGEFASKKDLLSQALGTDDYFAPAIRVVNLLGRSSQVEPAVTLAIDLIEQNLGPIESHLSNPTARNNYSPQKEQTECIEAILGFGKFRNQDEAAKIFGRNLDILRPDVMESGLLPSTVIPALEMACSSDDKDSASKADEILTQKIGMFGGYFDNAFQHKGYAREIAIKLVKNKLNNFGVNSDALIEKWLDSSPGISVVRENLQALISLEKRRPGIGRLLNEQFGICNFARYPEEMLIAQYDEVDKTDIPYGVIMFSSFDHNGAFYTDRQNLNSLHRQIKGKYALRVVEAVGKLDIAKRLHRLSRKYGDNNKISFAIVGGHGNEDSIQFGEGRSVEGAFNYSDVFFESVFGRGRLAGYSNYFVKNPTVILLSCSTGKGKKGGIAGILSSTFGTVIAPSENVTGASFKIAEENGRLSFEVKYKGAKTVTFVKGRPVNPNTQN